MHDELIKRLREKSSQIEWSTKMLTIAALLDEAAAALSRPAPAVQVPVWRKLGDWPKKTGRYIVAHAGMVGGDGYYVANLGETHYTRTGWHQMPDFNPTHWLDYPGPTGPFDSATVATEAVAQGNRSAVAQGGGVDVEKVMALVERYAAERHAELAEIPPLAEEARAEAKTVRAQLRALLTSPAILGE